MDRRVFPEIAKLALTLLRKGSKWVRVDPYRAAPEVVSEAEGELRQQVTEQRIGNCRSRPARTSRLLGLLEVIAECGWC